MSDALREAVRNANSDRVRKNAAALVLQATVTQVDHYLGQTRRQIEETGRLIAEGDREQAKVVGLAAREALLKMRREMRFNIVTAVSMLQGEERRTAYEMFGTFFVQLEETR